MLRVTHAEALNVTQRLDLLESESTLDLQADITLGDLYIGGSWNDETGQVDGGIQVPGGQYDGDGPLPNPTDLTAYVNFSDGAGGYHVLTIYEPPPGTLLILR